MPPMTANCPNCGTSVSPNAKFCPNCGSALKQGIPGKQKTKAATSNSAPQKLSGINLLYLVAVLSLVVVGFYGYKYVVPVKNASTHVHDAPANTTPQLDQTRLNELKKKLDVNPNGFQENVEMGNFLFDNHDFEQALVYYKKALAKKKNDPDVLVDAGVSYFNLKNIEEASNYFKQALNVNPKHPNALYNLGIVSAQTGDMPGMLKYWKKLIEVAPESGPAQNAKRMIDQVKNSQTDQTK